MRFFLTETARASLLDLSKEVNRKVLNFERKVRECRDSNGLHLEKIDSFPDPSMRTARIDDKYRAVVSLHEGSLYLLYYANHDDAYDWGNRTRFEWNEEMQTCQLVPVKEVGSLPQLAKSEEASILATLKDAQLMGIGVPRSQLELARQIQGLDDLETYEATLATEAYESIFDLFDGKDIETILAEKAEGRAPAGEDPQLSANNRRHCVLVTDDEDLAQMLCADMEAWQLFLHPSQRRLVEGRFNGPVKVTGGAGTGKTVAALHRAKWLVEHGQGKVLLTTYTNSLQANLQKLASRMALDANRYTIDNVDALVRSIGKKYKVGERLTVIYRDGKPQRELFDEVLSNRPSSFNCAFLIREYEEVILQHDILSLESYLAQTRGGRGRGLDRAQREEVWRLIGEYRHLRDQRLLIDQLELFNNMTRFLNNTNCHPYSHVIVDELQDFSNPVLRFIRALAPEGPDDIYLTGDPMQRIYAGRRVSFGSLGINVRGRSRRLKVNYRTTEAIKRTAVAVVRGGVFEDMEGGNESLHGYVSLLRGGERPVYEW